MARSRQKRSKTVSLVEASGDGESNGTARRFDSVGGTLRAERERLRWDIGDVAQQLKIRRVHLEAIEDDRFDLVPSGTYAVNFVRAYSDALGLDSIEMVRRYREALAGGDRRLELHFPQPLPESKLPGGIILLVSFAIAALGYGAWLVLNQGMRDTVARVDPVPQQLQQSVSPPPPAPSVVVAGANTAPEARSSGGEAAQPNAATPAERVAPAAPPPSILAVVPAPPASPAPAAPPPSPPPSPPAAAPMAGGAAASATVIPASPPAPAQLAPVAPTPQPAPQVTETPQGTRIFGEPGPTARIVIVAQADSWVQVREANGTTIFMRILKAGDVYNVPNRGGLLLTTGSAGSIELRVDGKVAPSLGNRGFVRRDVPLEPERLLAGSGGEGVRPPQAAPVGRSGG